MWTKYTSQHVTPSRVFDARSARMKLASVQRHKVGRNFVATTPPARGIPSCRRRISLVPPPYPSAVSKNVTPARAASSQIRRSVASGIKYPLIRRSSAVVPHIIVPIPIGPRRVATVSGDSFTPTIVPASCPSRQAKRYVDIKPDETDNLSHQVT